MDDQTKTVGRVNFYAELRARAVRVPLVAQGLRAQGYLMLSERDLFGMLACDLSDALEATQAAYEKALASQIVAPVEVIKDGATVRYAFLGNAAREMYDTLKEVVDWLDLWQTELGTAQEHLLEQCNAAIAKAEGRNVPA